MRGRLRRLGFLRRSLDRRSTRFNFLRLEPREVLGVLGHLFSCGVGLVVVGDRDLRSTFVDDFICLPPSYLGFPLVSSSDVVCPSMLNAMTHAKGGMLWRDAAHELAKCGYQREFRLLDLVLELAAFEGWLPVTALAVALEGPASARTGSAPPPGFRGGGGSFA